MKTLRNILSTCLLFVAIAATAIGQTVSRVEYYWDNDPGRGNGIPITGWSAANQVNINTTISTAGLSAGIHTLGIRSRSSHGVWSSVGLHRVVVGQQVSRIEYFYDTDPGFGQGRAYATTATGNTVMIDNAQLSATGISDGFHRLGIRARAGTNGMWSPTYWQQVLVNGKGVVQVEYFYDSVPDYGQGIQYTAFTQGSTVTINNAQLSATGISDGFHRLGIRAKAGGPNGLWSPVYWQNVIVNGAGITQVEYYWDDAHPAHGAATPLTGFTPGSIVTITNSQISTAGLATGVHRLALRARSGNGMWSPTYFHEVFVGSGADYAEYYWDTDPGYGQATPIDFTPGEVAMVNISNIAVPTSDGLHTLAIRARAGKTWSPTYIKTYCNAPTPMFSLLGSDTVCQGEQIIILDETEGASAQTQYTWDMQSDGTVDDQTAGDLTYTYAQPGIYELTLGVGNNATCQNTYSKTIVVRSTQNPTISISRNLNNVCEGTEVRFVATTQRAANYSPQIMWFRNDALMPGIMGDTIYLSDLHNNDRIRAKVRIYNPCAPADSAQSSQLTMRIYPLPSVTMQHQRFIFSDEQAFTLTSRFAGTPTGGTYSINGTNTTLFNPTRNENGIYTISYTYTNSNGCSTTVVDSFELRDRVEYMLTAQSADPLQGTVSGSGQYTIGDTATLTALPSTSYVFSHWGDGDSANPRKVEVLSDTTLTAYWERLCRDTVIVEEATSCDSYAWRGATYTSSGDTATRTFASLYGCDSSYVLHLTVLHSTVGEVQATACDSYTWHGTEYTASTNEATYTSANAAGCDSTTTLHLTMNYSGQGVETMTTCDEYLWKGTAYTTSGSYTFDTLTAKGCDSIVTLTLTVNHSGQGVMSVTACDEYTWKGTAYTASGSYSFDTLTTKGCDSTVTLQLTVNHSNTGTESVTACNSYVWHGTEYTASTNEAMYTTTNAAGCDSTTTLHLTINHCATTELTVCDSYTWPLTGATYTASGVYTDGTDTLVLTVNHSSAGTDVQSHCDSYTWVDGVTYTTNNSTATHLTENVYGCDSTVTLALTIRRSSTGAETVTACDSYTWHGTEYTASTNEATYTSANAAGCDSTTTLHLTVNYSGQGVETMTSCDEYLWKGTAYTTSGSYTFDTLTAKGCDSTVTLTLTVNHSGQGSLTVTACDEYTWKGTAYTASGSYSFDTLTTKGCDSTVTLALTVNHSNTGTESVTACNSYVWHGTEYTASTSEATYTTTNAAGCDSTVTLQLTIDHCATTELTVCDSYTWPLTGATYTASGVYTDGTDTLVLTVNHSSAGTDVQSHCDSYTWVDGVTYTTNNSTATHLTENVYGCDSTVTLALTIRRSSTGSETVTACNSYTWHGTEYTASTDAATYTTTNAAGCDSTVTLHLTINHCSATVVAACDSYEWHGTTYNVSGTYVDGNDTLRLTISYSNAVTEVVTACDRYEWHGTEYVVSTTNPRYTTTNAAGCDSTVTLNLTIKRSTSVMETVTACDSYTWHGTTYTEGGNGVGTYSTTNAVGCDSTVTLNLTLKHSSTGDTTVTACDQYTWGGVTYTTSGDVTLGTNMHNAAGCDSTLVLHLTVTPSYNDTVSAVACDSWQGYTADTTLVERYTTVAGCDSISTILVTINHSVETTIVDSAAGEYTWNGEVYAESGTYTWTGSTEDGCDSTVTLVLTIDSTGNSGIRTADDIVVRVYPNPTTGTVSLDADDVQRVEVYDQNGRMVRRFEETNVVELDGLSSGSYMLKIEMRRGTTLKRVILR